MSSVHKGLCGIIYILLIITLILSNINGAVARQLTTSSAVITIARAPIIINNDMDFNSANGVVAGNGTITDPYIIENWDINATGYSSGIYIGNTSSYFILRNNNVTSADAAGIVLFNVTNGKIENNRINNSFSFFNLRVGILLVYAYNNIISNNTLDSNDVGIYVYGSTNNNITNNSVSSFFSVGVGIYMELSNNNQIYGNSIDFSGLLCLFLFDCTTIGSIMLETSIDNVISNNAILGTGSSGFLLLNSSENKIIGNLVFLSAEQGIYLNSSANNVIENNWVQESRKHGIYLVSAPSNSIINNLVLRSSDNGITLDDSSRTTITGNNLDSSTDDGIYINNSSETTISNNYATGNDNGVYLRMVSNSTITNNTLTGNGYGAYLDSTSNINVTSNNITDNTVFGMYVIYSNDITLNNNNVSNNRNTNIYFKNTNNIEIQDNLVSQSEYGIFVESSNNTQIRNGTIVRNNVSGLSLLTSRNVSVIYSNIEENSYGIILNSTLYTTITYNFLSRNGLYGINVTNTSWNNSIHHNGFINNSLLLTNATQAIDENGTNNWNFSEEGNYWTDFDEPVEGCYDNDTNWICDAPYLLDGYVNAMDYYPLTTPLGIIVPSAPQNLTGYGGNRTISLVWLPPKSSGFYPITNYRLYKNGTVLTQLGTNTTFVDYNVINGVNYTYYVTAINSGGESQKSNIVNITPLSIPYPPKNLTGTAGNHRNSLSWQAPDDNGGTPLTNYKIYRDGLYLTTVSATSTTYVDTNVTNGVAYKYSVSALNIIGESNKSNEVLLTPLGTPSEPRTLSAVAGDGYVSLQWQIPLNNGGSTITNYRIYRNGALLSQIGTNTTYTDYNVINGVTYIYQISALNVAGEGPKSSSVSATPKKPYVQPSEPLNLTGTPDNRRIVLRWQPPASDGGSPITNYRIYRNASLLTEIGTNTTFDDYNVENGISYSYQVSAVNLAGEGNKSNIIVVVPRTVPEPPRALTGTANINNVSLQWDAPLNNGGSEIKNYRIYRNATLLTEIGVNTTYIDFEVAKGTTYIYYVTAVNEAGESANSNKVTVTLPKEPDAPQNLSAIAGNRNVSLRWDPPSSDGGLSITNYRIYKNGTFLIDVGLNLTYIDTNVSNGIQYTYAVSAVNLIGESEKSVEVNATPITVPSAPQNLNVTGGDNNITLSWDKPLDDGGSPITGYRIYRNGTLLAEVSGNRTYIDFNVISEVDYTYAVSAINGAGEGDKTAPVVARTATKKPSVSGEIFPWWLVIALLILMGIIIAGVFYWRKKKPKKIEPTKKEKELKEFLKK